jgi:nitrilase
MRGNIVGKVKVAVIQASSVIFDKTASIEKACDLIEKAGNKGAKIVLLPEAFIPAYPRGFTFGMKIGSRNEDWRYRARWCFWRRNTVLLDVLFFTRWQVNRQT